MHIKQVPSQYVSLVWPVIKAFVDKSAKYSGDRTESEDIRQDCENGTVFLWVAHDDNHDTHGFVTGQFLDYPGMKVLALQFTGGRRLREWSSDMWNTLESFARDNGCSKIEGAGRIGWLRFMKQFGCTPAFYIYEKDLRDG
jgi:hypothetical protein